MFKHLKRKFMLIYSISISVLVIFSFCAVFYSSYSNTISDINTKLSFKDNIQQKPSNEKITDVNINEENDEIIGGEAPIDVVHNPFAQTPDGEYNIQVFGSDMFFLLDNDNNIIDSASQSELTVEEIAIIQEAIDTNVSIFKLGDKYYTYGVSSTLVKVIDISQSLLLLKNLLITLLYSGLLLIIISIFIGNWFASKALKPVEKSFIKQQSFVSDASHELKTPISVISSCLELIKDKDDESEKWIDYCISETNRLKNLTSDLLSLSVDNSNINIKEIPTYNISEQLELVSCAYEAKFFEEKFNFISSIEKNLEIKFLDDDFKQLFHLLMDNAIKYNDNRKKINISLKKEDKNVVFTIANSADYISDKDLKNIFDRFYRQDKARNKKIQGFGLGLSLVKSMMTKYKLKYSVQYNDTMFTFYIKFPLND